MKCSLQFYVWRREALEADGINCAIIDLTDLLGFVFPDFRWDFILKGFAVAPPSGKLAETKVGRVKLAPCDLFLFWRSLKKNPPKNPILSYTSGKMANGSHPSCRDVTEKHMLPPRPRCSSLTLPGGGDWSLDSFLLYMWCPSGRSTRTFGPLPLPLPCLCTCPIGYDPYQTVTYL